MKLPAWETALVCVDFQNDFCHEDGFFAQAGHDVSPCAAAAAHAFATAAAARAAGVTIVLTRTVRTDPAKRRLRPSRHPEERSAAASATLGKPSYLPDAWGTQILPDLLPLADLVVDKPRQSPFHRTELEQDLRSRGLGFVVVAGVTTNCCVDCTIRDAAVRDFDVLVLDDCVGAFAAERHLHDATLENASRFFGVVDSAEAFLGALA